MAEYIEREAAIAWFMPYVHTEERIGADDVIEDIRSLPAADVVPVVRAKWEFSHTTSDGFAVVKCQNCGHEAFAIAFYVREGHFCPNCGAKMETEEKKQ